MINPESDTNNIPPIIETSLIMISPSSPHHHKPASELIIHDEQERSASPGCLSLER